MNLLRTGGRILASRIGQAALNGVCAWLVARTLGPVGQGHYSLTVTIAIFAAALLNGGMGLAAVPPLRRGEIGLGTMLRAQRGWILATAALLAAVAAAAWMLLPDGMMARHLDWDPALLALTALAAAALLAFDILFYDLLALGRLLAGPLVNLGRAALHLAILGGAALTGILGLRAAVLAYGASQTCAAAVVAVILAAEVRRRRRDGAPAYAPPRTRSLIADTIARGWLGQLSAVVSLLHLRLDLAIVAFFCGAAEVGVYSVAVMVGELLWLLPSALQPVLVYTSSEGEGTGADDDPAAAAAARDAQSARAVRVALAATAAVALGLGIVARPLFDFLLPASFAGSVPALYALLPGIVLFAAGAVLAGDFIGRGRPAWNTAAGGVTVAVNVIAGLLLIPAHGAVGAAWASSIAYAAGSLAMVARFRSVSGLGLGRILICRPSDFRRR